jgi:hypothetical protein
MIEVASIDSESIGAKWVARFGPKAGAGAEVNFILSLYLWIRSRLVSS